MELGKSVAAIVAAGTGVVLGTEAKVAVAEPPAAVSSEQGVATLKVSRGGGVSDLSSVESGHDPIAFSEVSPACW